MIESNAVSAEAPATATPVLSGAPGGTAPAYEPNPHYPPRGGAVGRGWPDAIASVPTTVAVVGIDGPAGVDWDHVIDQVAPLLAGHTGRAVDVVDLREAACPWPTVAERTSSSSLSADADFEMLAQGRLVDLIDPARLPTDAPAPDRVRLAVGPGAAVLDPDSLWWADLPKRFTEAAVAAGSGRNLFSPAGMVATTRRLFYIDWPLEDRHRDEHVGAVDLWLDLQPGSGPHWIAGDTLRRTCSWLATVPHRTRPTFNSTPWGGQWGRRTLGHRPESTNTALGYELIAPESGVLVGDDPEASVEVPFQLVVALEPRAVLGAEFHRRFGTSFPIRFDYLDTVDGGNLSVHCHPQEDYMRDVFGWPYTQHETYYVLVGAETNRVFLGLRSDVATEDFHAASHQAAQEGVPFDITEFVQTFPATPHQLFLIPAGTPHGSGQGNVVLEVSATPYLYSLRFYDWLRKDAAKTQRPVHVEHAFRNLDQERSGERVRDQLVQSPRTVDSGDGWHEEMIGALPEMFFEVRRVVVQPGSSAPQRADDRFHVLTLVDGAAVEIRTAGGDRHRLNYAETIAIPAAVGRYTVQNLHDDQVRLVKAQVS